jgi:acyl-CoA synthetase (AMP-forming)/AMP-acid ligase II
MSLPALAPAAQPLAASSRARHEQVSEAAVVGVPDARLGEVGRAFVVPRPGPARR